MTNATVLGNATPRPVKPGRFHHSEKMAFLMLLRFKDRYHNLWLNSKMQIHSSCVARSTIEDFKAYS